MTDYSILSYYILETYLGNLSGKNLEDEFVAREPESRVMVGKLAASRVQKKLSDGSYEEVHENEFKSIPSINMTFTVLKNECGRLLIKPRGLLMYTIAPDYQKTIDYVLSEFSQKYHRQFHSIKELSDFESKFDIPNTYKKIQISDYLGDGFEISLKGLQTCEFNLQDAIRDKLFDLIDKISDEIRICNSSKISILDLQTKEDFERATRPKSERVFPSWRIDIYCKVVEAPDSYNFFLQMVNRTEISGKTPGYIPVVFDSGISIIGNEQIRFVPIELENLLSSYKEREPVYATAENTSVRYVSEKNMLISDNVPYYIQYRLKTNDSLCEYTTFEALLNDLFGNLKHINKEMLSDFDRCCKEFATEKEKLSLDAICKYSEALKEYENEINRYEKGIRMLECHDFVKSAFKYMLQTFQTELPFEHRKINGWRLFQIVFIVSMIPDVIRSEYKDDKTNWETDNANLLYFPTGGGKTEAFLGVCIFTMFFDRLRGKNEGISAFLKYPLRLLAVQQLDRVLTVVAKANKVLHSSDELLECSDFSIGFFVGKSITPNRLEEIVGEDESLFNQRFRFIDTCPYCGKKTVNVRLDLDRYVLRHYCDNPDCNHDELPLLIVDEEIYRYLPSLVICTIDKMAALGLTGRFRSLFGQVKSKCSKHGFSTTNKCSCYKCNNDVYQVSELKDPIPTLFIQDEMHLVKESLGTFDAHYEAFIDYYAKNLVPASQRKHIKYIGASATISRYKDHIQHLYHKNAIRFPCEYPSRKSGQDFYSYTDKNDITRIITGFSPYGQHSIMDGMWHSVYEMHKLIFGLIMNRGLGYKEVKKRGFQGTEESYFDMLYDYWVELVYNNRKNDADELMNSFTNQANNALIAEGIEQFRIESMTSDEDFQKVRNILFNISENHKKLDSTNLILATSTISHGVDEDSFNSMFFFGMPNNNAEYIQAYSRVGRKYSGIVVDIIRLIRLRDRSYLRNFIIFHSNQDDMVESVPINRWARNAIYNTLPGLLSGLFLQYYYRDSKSTENDFYAIKLKKMLVDGEVEPDAVANLIVEILGCNEGEKLSMVYMDIIRAEVKRVLNSIKDTECSGSLSEAISKFSKGHRAPMNSLRDTQEQVFIEIKE